MADDPSKPRLFGFFRVDVDWVMISDDTCELVYFLLADDYLVNFGQNFIFH